MTMLDKALLAKRQGLSVEAHTFFQSALEDERAAALELKDQISAEPSRSILLRSAANIAQLSGDGRESERLIAIALAGDPPEDIAEELRDLLVQASFARHHRTNGTKMDDVDASIPNINGAAHRELKFHYDQIGDILYIDRCKPYAEQESEAVGDDIVVRLNPGTNEVENVEILFYSKRLQQTNDLILPFFTEMRLAA